MTQHATEQTPPGTASGISALNHPPRRDGPSLILNPLASTFREPKAARSVQAMLDCYAVLAIGVRPAGPWRLAVANWYRMRQAINSFNCHHWDFFEVGAVVMLPAEAWAKRVQARAEGSLIKPGSALKAPWFLAPQESLTPALLAAAAEENAQAMTWPQYVARVDTKVERLLAGELDAPIETGKAKPKGARR